MLLEDKIYIYVNLPVRQRKPNPDEHVASPSRQPRLYEYRCIRRCD